MMGAGAGAFIGSKFGLGKAGGALVGGVLGNFLGKDDDKKKKKKHDH